MLNEASKKIKGLVLSAAMKHLSQKDKLSMIFFSTMTSNINDVVILPATVSVAKKIHSRVRNPRRHGLIHSGTISSVPVTIARTGVGTASVATMMEVFKLRKPKAIVRVDYCGAIDERLKVGDVSIATGALPGDGTSMQYIAANMEALRPVLTGGAMAEARIPVKECPDPVHDWLARKELTGPVPASEAILEKCLAAAREASVAVTKDVVWTTDGLFLETKEKISYWRARGAGCVDMETSILYLLGTLYELPVVAIHGVSDNVVAGPPFYELDSFDPGIEEGIKKACDVLERLVPKL